MPQTTSHPDESPYPRENFFDSQNAEDYVTTDTTNGGHTELTGTRRSAWIAHKILRETGTMLCAASLFEPPETDGALHDENESIELTEPCVHVPHTFQASWGEVDYGQRRHRSRYNPKYGYLDAGVVIQDRPTDEFMNTVDAVLDAAGLTQRPARSVREFAYRLKQAGRHRDTDILEKVVEAIEHPSSPGDYIDNHYSSQ